MTANAADEMVDAILASPKYRRIARETVVRVVTSLLRPESTEGPASPGDVAAALKAAKRSLHQACGAFIRPADCGRITGLVDALKHGAALEDVCDAALRLHASTAERLPHYREFYEKVFAVTGAPTTVCDAGCGLSPFSIPYMRPSRPARYVAVDIDSTLVDRINEFLPFAGCEPCARTQDVISAPPGDEVDLALALKLLPVLEQQVRGCWLGVLRGMRARRLVVSFPLLSLGGRRKGMPSHYREQYESRLEQEFLMQGEFELPNELVYIMSPRVKEAG